MAEKETNVTLKYITKYQETVTEGVFVNLPSDLSHFLKNPEGTMRGIVDNLRYDQDYEITISIKSAK